MTPGVRVKLGAACTGLALAGTLTPSAATAAEGDVTISGTTYTRVVFDHAIKGWDGENWFAECPPEFPYLSKNHSSNEQRVGYGLHITEETPSALHIVQGRFFDAGESGPTWEELENGRSVATGNSGTVSNWSIVRQHLTIKMECTSSLSQAWLDMGDSRFAAE